MASEQPMRIMHRTIRLGDVLDLSAAVVAIGLLALVYAGRSGVPRVLLALGFTFFVPGRAIVSNWPRMAGWSQAAMAMVLSIAVLGLLAAGMLWTHLWHPVGLLTAEALISVAGLGLGITRRNMAAPGGQTSSEP